jgi:hypothetical protein
VCSQPRSSPLAAHSLSPRSSQPLLSQLNAEALTATSQLTTSTSLVTCGSRRI